MWISWKVLNPKYCNCTQTFIHAFNILNAGEGWVTAPRVYPERTKRCGGSGLVHETTTPQDGRGPTVHVNLVQHH